MTTAQRILKEKRYLTIMNALRQMGISDIEDMDKDLRYNQDADTERVYRGNHHLFNIIKKEYGYAYEIKDLKYNISYQPTNTL